MKSENACLLMRVYASGCGGAGGGTVGEVWGALQKKNVCSRLSYLIGEKLGAVRTCEYHFPFMASFPSKKVRSCPHHLPWGGGRGAKT